ncbi:MAG: DNA mismatch repair endonuclease MutL [Lachnospiraceae bacterium]|nr:DNA mismatch repair endonuclease MutL [Lachnospiraceae bacterium]
MASIHILSHETIDKIAAGEVVERPASIVKELVENAIDAKATAVTVEIKDGGISFIRVSDNGCGIEKSEIRKAFLRHATSKIQDADDLMRLHSLGFRGEALSSISAVSQTEMITKTKEELTGVRISMEGPAETDFEEVGAPDGTTIIVRNLFFNVPARRKFLKQPATEGGYVADLMEHLALANPQVSFQFIQNNQVKFSTAGNGDLKQTVYKLYGKDMTDALIPIDRQGDGIRLSGYLGKPSCNRSNRNYELYFLNGRFIKSNLVSKALEEGYKSYLMQHKYPFCVLMMEVEPSRVDVNVHPAKMEVRFTEEMSVYAFLTEAVKTVLDAHEMIPEIALTPPEKKEEKEKALEPFQKARAESRTEDIKSNLPVSCEIKEKPKATSKDFFVDFGEEEEDHSEIVLLSEKKPVKISAGKVQEDEAYTTDRIGQHIFEDQEDQNEKQSRTEEFVTYNETQLNLFEEKIISETARKKFRILGQAFDTYWIVVYEDKLLMIDQHAAHEKVKYERIMKAVRESETVSQNLYPPLVLSLSGREQEILAQYQEAFEKLGFELEYFGGNEITVRSAPAELFGSTIKDMFLEVLDELSATGIGRAKSIEERIATMACKAAVKGNMRMTVPEMETLLDELLTLDNPYFCPHGRPTIISFTKQELEKKFKRIV